MASCKPENEIAINWIRDWVKSRLGVHFADNRLDVLESRLATLSVRMGFASITALQEDLAAGTTSDVPIQVAHVCTTNHTHFFRESQILDYFQDKVLATLPPGDDWRMWSAASSSGEELYTNAMILIQKYGLQQVSNHIALLGTDVSANVISQAERGIYHTRRLETMDSAIRGKFFKKAGLENWVVNPEVRALCTFRRMNLISDHWPFSNQFHVIFLRNVLYYFESETQEQVLNQIYNVTLPHGWLITSVTESITHLKTKWQKVSPGIYRKGAL